MTIVQADPVTLVHYKPTKILDTNINKHVQFQSEYIKLQKMYWKEVVRVYISKFHEMETSDNKYVLSYSHKCCMYTC